MIFSMLLHSIVIFQLIKQNILICFVGSVGHVSRFLIIVLGSLGDLIPEGRSNAYATPTRPRDI